ncbi:MAG TPA: biotin carboxylase N-terminal domain-containing protein, partial [Fimbriimonadaceae bacterium]|nr:biotin carboxylase N-terminal domain-containing protein [Fimbriimonadaceae bacterium]
AMISKLLIANRGEIAIRIIRAAREMGIGTVAVYSEADAHSMHVALADEAVLLGAPEPGESYLRIDKIIDAARSTGADAIHPGYGFLSEREELPEACEEAGITFVGPPASAMRSLGSKIDAKTLAVRAGVPITPGFFEKGASEERLGQAADEIGYPVMLKASAGGGGRGMRIVRDPESFREELRIASDEALKAFGDGAMMVEKLVDRPRHVEVQVLADRHGNAAVLYERECSIQRRHQKLIEEAPAPVFSREIASGVSPRMREAALNLVRESGYVNAGTLEFLVDPTSGEFYFMEVNARLQVEHPVTEMITGVDLVQQQLRIAGGAALDVPAPVLAGDRAGINGHSIEVRIVAEDPAAGFMPSIGPVRYWAEPKMPGVRVDSGYSTGAEVSRYYDSLLAKVIVHASTRESALDRLEAALLDFHVLGVKTNIEYILDVIRSQGFREGDFDTGYLGREFSDWQPSEELPAELGAIVSRAGVSAVGKAAEKETATAWAAVDGFRNAR